MMENGKQRKRDQKRRTRVQTYLHHVLPVLTPARHRARAAAYRRDQHRASPRLCEHATPPSSAARR